VIKNTK